MPELPEVETSVQAIQEFAGQNIESIKINNPNLRWKLDSLAFSKLKKQRVKTIYRRAKYILFKLEKNIVLIHLGMTGTLRIAEKSSNFYKKHDHIEFIFLKNKLIFNDPRRFGSMHIISDPNKPPPITNYMSVKIETLMSCLEKMYHNHLPLNAFTSRFPNARAKAMLTLMLDGHRQDCEKCDTILDLSLIHI